MSDDTPVVDPVSGEGDISKDEAHQVPAEESPSGEDGAPVAEDTVPADGVPPEEVPAEPVDV